MTKAILFSIIYFTANVCFAQTDIDLVKRDFQLMQEQLQFLKKEIVLKDSAEYIKTKYSILNAIENGPKLVFDFTKITERINVAGLFSKLNKANSPASDILGVSFVDVVSRAAETHFILALPPEDKPRFADILNKIIKNPIVSSVLNSNPVTSVVASITNVAAGFFSSSAIGRSGRDVKIETKNLLEQKNLEDFNKELSPYISFYDNMIKSTDKYLMGVNQLNNKYSYLKDTVNNYNAKLYKTLNIIKNNGIPLTTQAEAEFKLTSDKYNNLDYQKNLQKASISSAKNIADNYKVIEVQVNNFKGDYNELLKTYLRETSQLLSGAKYMTLSKGFNPNQIEALIVDIDSFTRTLDTEKNIPSNIQFYRMNQNSVRINAFGAF